MEELLAKLKVPPDAAAAELYQSVQPLRQMVAFQAAFVAGCCQQAMELGTSKLQEKFAFTWQQRLAAYRALPDGTEVPPPDGDAAAPPELLVGLVGCGALGTTVVQTLLDAGFAPSQLLVSTRSPQQHQALLAQGVRVAFHNAGVAARVHLLVLAVLPAQLADVAKDIRGALSPRTLVFSCVAAVSEAKLRQLLTSPANPEPHVLRARADAALVRARVRAAAAAAAAAASSSGAGASASAPAPASAALRVTARTKVCPCRPDSSRPRARMAAPAR